MPSFTDLLNDNGYKLSYIHCHHIELINYSSSEQSSSTKKLSSLSIFSSGIENAKFTSSFVIILALGYRFFNSLLYSLTLTFPYLKSVKISSRLLSVSLYPLNFYP